MKISTPNQTIRTIKAGFAAFAITATLAGCSSMTVNSDSLTQRTTQALGLTPDRFTISNRTDSGIRTDYLVATRTGETYSCYVTGMFSVMGRTVSDAICTRMNSDGSRSATPAGAQSSRPCNALLRAAGKCD